VCERVDAAGPAGESYASTVIHKMCPTVLYGASTPHLHEVQDRYIEGMWSKRTSSSSLSFTACQGRAPTRRQRGDQARRPERVRQPPAARSRSPTTATLTNTAALAGSGWLSGPDHRDRPMCWFRPQRASPPAGSLALGRAGWPLLARRGFGGFWGRAWSPRAPSPSPRRRRRPVAVVGLGPLKLIVEEAVGASPTSPGGRSRPGRTVAANGLLDRRCWPPWRRTTRPFRVGAAAVPTARSHPQIHSRLVEEVPWWSGG
jgi:hypothetical protein